MKDSMLEAKANGRLYLENSIMLMMFIIIEYLKLYENSECDAEGYFFLIQRIFFYLI